MNKKYKEYNDYELISYIAENNEEALDILLEKYKNLVNVIAKKKYNMAHLSNMEYADLYQEGMIGLLQAIRNFKESANVTFYTFASLCIERKMNTAILRANRKKNTPLNTSISYDNFDDEKNLLEVIDSKNLSPEEKMIDLEEEVELFSKIKEDLSNLELQIFELRINNFSYDEIAKILNTTTKNVYNAIVRIKTKVRKYMTKLS